MVSNILGPVIRDLRKEQHLTQKELSLLTGIAQNTISNHENQNRSLDETDIAKYAKALNKTPQQMFDAATVQSSKNAHKLVADKRQNLIGKLTRTVIGLETPRIQKVYQYAQQELSDQNEPTLIAAHTDDNLTEEQQSEVNDFIAKIKREHEQ